MRVTLPSGHYAEIRDNLEGGDKRLARKAIRTRIEEDGSRQIGADLEDSVKYAILTQLITSWDYPDRPIPSAAVDATAALDKLPLPDLDALEKAIQPVYDLVMEVAPKAPTNSSASA